MPFGSGGTQHPSKVASAPRANPCWERGGVHTIYPYGIPGIVLAAAAICDRCACPDIQKFVNGLPYRPFVRDALAKQLNENDDSLSSGVFGNLAIAHRILPDSEFHFLVEEVRASNLLAVPRPDLLPGLMTMR